MVAVGMTAAWSSGTDLEAADSTGTMDPFSGGTGSTGNRALVFFLGCYIIGTGRFIKNTEPILRLV